jgi:hypothetical protein
MTTDIQMKVRGLCETLASAYASAAACHQALAEIVGIDNEVGLMHRALALHSGDFDLDVMLADSLAVMSDPVDTPSWPDALERRTRAEVS